MAMNGFYQPNWAALFGPSVNRANQQAQQSQQANQQGGFGFGMNPGMGFGLNGFMNPLRRRSRMNWMNQQQQQPMQQPMGNPGLMRDQAIMMEMQGRGVDPFAPNAIQQMRQQSPGMGYCRQQTKNVRGAY